MNNLTPADLLQGVMESNLAESGSLESAGTQTGGAVGAQPASCLAHDSVAAQAAALPHATAVSGPQASLTFQQLDRESNRLARRLQSLGVGPEVPVGLYFERSPDFVVAALAVLKAGEAYVPLDPALPPDRISSILEDAQTPVLLSHKWMAAGLRSGAWSVVDLDIDAARIQSFSSEPLEGPRVSGAHLAYVIYTSGSTGKPKGVEVTHANLAHLIGWHGRAFNVTPRDRASVVAGLAFDAAVWEIWCHLAAGASVHFADETSRRSPEGMKDWLVQNKITIAFAPTVMAEHLMTQDWPVDTALRILLTGADTLHRYPKAGLPFALVNNYGPTECTVLVTSGVVPVSGGSGPPSIGRPIDGAEIFVVDDKVQPVGAGEAGEICVAGAPVARGYRNLPELTAEKFVRATWAPGGRLYRTGDRGRFLPSGEIEFLGRIDDQIKIRGFRVEPGDVVMQLVAHPDIRNAVVTAAGETEKFLVAHLVLVSGSPVTGNALREFLKGHLPDYMIPQSFIRVDSLPVTNTGKIDKQALPAPSADNLLRDENSAAKGADGSGASETEKRIIQIVSALMGGREIGHEDNFFLIGGHSMLAAQLLAKVREGFGISLSLRQLFEAPTARALAALLEQRKSRS